jgi:Family of unknown function (DUF5999)
MTVTRITASSKSTTTVAATAQVTGLAAGHPGCTHAQRCPAWDAPDHAAARVVSAHPEQGWSLLCNGVIVFSDTGEILPSQASVAPHRPSTGRTRARSLQAA